MEERKMNKMKFFFVVFILFGLFGFIPNSYSLCATGELYVGTAKVDITPSADIIPVDIEPLRVIHDPVYARILVLDVNGYRIAIISCDLAYYYDRDILDIARERFNIPHLIICSSHTHSGPRFSESYVSPDYDAPYGRALEKAMIDGLDEAVKNMFPARISSGYSFFPQLSYNRLTMREDGHARALFENWEKIPHGTVDPEVGVIKIEDENGNLRVVLMAYACHPVVVMRNYEFSADYVGAATRKVEETFGSNTICMFAQGGAGDMNPLFMSRRRKSADDDSPIDYESMEKMGTLLSNEVIKVVKSLSSKTNEQTTLKAMYDSLKFTGRFDKNLTFNMHFTTVLINDDIAIVTMPGEPFIRFQLYWKEHAEVSHPFFFGYTFSSGGDYPGYVPDIRSAAYGGYGADNRETLIQIGAGEAIMNKHLENLYRLRGIVRDKPGPP